MGKTTDLSGERFGKLTVIERANDYIYKNGRHRSRWICRCDCGNTTIVFADALKRGLTKSCGCLAKETLSKYKFSKKYNDYDLFGEYGIGYDCNGSEFYFDLEDYDKIKDYCWYITKDGYVICTYGRILMHRLIMNFPNSVIDHIHGKVSRNDNRKSNLRVATHSQNSMNTKLRSDNSSGVAGVTFEKFTNKWRSYITVNKKRKTLGRFDNFEDAVRARKDAEEKYFGEYSYDSSQKK